MFRNSTLFRRTFVGVVSLVEKSTLFPRTFLDVISIVEKSTLFPRTFFGVILLVEKSTLFPRTFLDVISMVEKFTLFPCLFFNEVSMGKTSTSFLIKLQANENIPGGFPLLVTLKDLRFRKIALLKLKSFWCNLLPLKFQLKFITSNIAKRTAVNFWVFTEQLLCHIIFGWLHSYEVTLVKKA